MKSVLAIMLLIVGSAFAQTHTGAMLDLPNAFTNTDSFSLGITVGPITFSQLAGISNSTTIIYISDGSQANPCAGGGSGALAIRINGAWSCASGAGTGTVTSIATTGPITGGTITATGTIACATCVTASSPGAGVAHFAGSTQAVTSSAVVGADMTNNTVTATQLAAQYSKGSCTEVWGGSGAANAMASGDDAIVNNSCYNDSAVTRTITAVKCRSDNAANTTVLTPTFGSAGTGTAILTGTVTCGNSYAYSATGTLTNTAWTTGTGIDPGMSTVGNATSIAMIVEYTF